MNEITLRLDTESGAHLYEQIYEYIKNEIREKKLPQGEKLPSTRSLAEHLQVSRSTVELAYEQLLSEGYIESSPYRGYYVCRVEELFSMRRDEVIEAPVKESERSCRYDFSLQGIDGRSFPQASWRSIYNSILLDRTDILFQLGDPRGEEELRIQIGRYLRASRGVDCRPEQIIVGAGNDYLLLLLEKILGPDRRIAIEDPTYQRAYKLFQACGYTISAISMDEYGMRADELQRSNADTAYVMPSHQYPSGVVMPIGRRTELLNWAMEGENRYLIEDDYDSEFRYRGKPIPALQASDRAGRVIYIGTFSKSITPAIRISFMVLPPRLLAEYGRRLRFLASTVPRADQLVLAGLIESGGFERHLNRMRKIYKAKHDLLLVCLRKLEDRFTVSGENAGLHLLLTDREGRTEKELIERAGQRDVRVYGLSSVGRLNPSPGGAVILLGYGGLTESEIKEGAERLREAWL